MKPWVLYRPPTTFLSIRLRAAPLLLEVLHADKFPNSSSIHISTAIANRQLKWVLIMDHRFEKFCRRFNHPCTLRQLNSNINDLGKNQLSCYASLVNVIATIVYSVGHRNIYL